MIEEIRVVVDVSVPMGFRVETRSRSVGLNASGAMCPGALEEWVPVPVLNTDKASTRPLLSAEFREAADIEASMPITSARCVGCRVCEHDEPHDCGDGVERSPATVVDGQDNAVVEGQIPSKDGSGLSSKIPRWDLIPTVAIDTLAERMMLGIARKGEKSWNALSSNQKLLHDLDFAINRCAHASRHAMELRDKLQYLKNAVNNQSGIVQRHLVTATLEGLTGDNNDAGALLWAGAFLACVIDTAVSTYGKLKPEEAKS